MFQLNKINYNNNGRTISYDYSLSPEIRKYFKQDESFYLTYDKDISNVPESINVIPLLSNIMPIAWFVGFDVYVNELDETFFESLQVLKKEFSIHFPEIKTDSKLISTKLVKNTFNQNNAGLLFSGGLDSFESLVRNLDHDPYLISVLGADIEINDTIRWNDFVKFNNEEKIIDKSKLFYVESNLQTFYTYQVDLLVNVGWWGKIQHGMALIAIIAPLSYLYNITTVFIASSNTGEVSFGWGSTFETDEKVKWANQKTIHDGFHLRRTQKIENIVTFAKKTGNYIKLRVCYSEWRKGYNCSKCAKCQRTMLGIILCGENPDDYGFVVSKDFYNLILKNFERNPTMTTGVAYEWKCLQEKALVVNEPFIIEDKNLETIKLDVFRKLNLDEIINKDLQKNKVVKKIKYIIITKFSKLFKLYLLIRRKI